MDFAGKSYPIQESWQNGKLKHKSPNSRKYAFIRSRDYLLLEEVDN
jgi:hypothetical protein